MNRLDLLDSVEAWLVADGLTAGYTVRFSTYDEADLTDRLPVMLLRKSGSGVVNSHIRTDRVRIAIMYHRTDIQAAAETAGLIEQKARSKNMVTDSVKTQLATASSDQIEMEGDVRMIYLDIEVTQ